MGICTHSLSPFWLRKFYRLFLTLTHLDHTLYPMEATNHPNRLEAVVAARMDELGLSIRKAAEMTGIPHATLSRRLKERGEPSFTVGELMRLADLFGITVSDIMTEFEKKAAAA